MGKSTKWCHTEEREEGEGRREEGRMLSHRDTEKGKFSKLALFSVTMGQTLGFGAESPEPPNFPKMGSLSLKI